MWKKAGKFWEKKKILEHYAGIVPHTYLIILNFRRLPGSRELYEYKCAGTYWDISPRSFLDAQNDIPYRMEWDSNVMTLELIQEEKEHEVRMAFNSFKE